jgi:hypothetical protein
MEVFIAYFMPSPDISLKKTEEKHEKLGILFIPSKIQIVLFPKCQ